MPTSTSSSRAARPVDMSPDFLLADVDRLAEELGPARRPGSGPRSTRCRPTADGTRSKLAELSRRTGIHVIASTGLHHEKFYGRSHWSRRLGEDEIADLFVADVADGIDANDYGGPVVRRTAVRAGLIKIAGSEGGPSRRDEPIFRAAAAAHRRTGVPVHTHCEAGTGRARADRASWPRPASPPGTSRSATSTRSSIAATSGHARDGGVRRLRPVVPLGRPAERDPPAASSGRAEDGPPVR